MSTRGAEQALLHLLMGVIIESYLVHFHFCNPDMLRCHISKYLLTLFAVTSICKMELWIQSAHLLTLTVELSEIFRLSNYGLLGGKKISCCPFCRLRIYDLPALRAIWGRHQLLQGLQLSSWSNSISGWWSCSKSQSNILYKNRL